MSKEHTHTTVQMGILYETNLSKNLYVYHLKKYLILQTKLLEKINLPIQNKLNIQNRIFCNYLLYKQQDLFI